MALRPLQEYVAARLQELSWGSAPSPLSETMWQCWLAETAAHLDEGVPVVLHVATEVAALSTAAVPDDPDRFTASLLDAVGEAGAGDEEMVAAAAIVDLAYAHRADCEALASLAAGRGLDCCRDGGSAAAARAAELVIDQLPEVAHRLAPLTALAAYREG